MIIDGLRTEWRNAYAQCNAGQAAKVLETLRRKEGTRKTLVDPPLFEAGALTWEDMDRRSFLIGPFGLGLGARLRIAIDRFGRHRFGHDVRDATGWPSVRDVGQATSVRMDRPIERRLVKAAIRVLPATWRPLTPEIFEQTPFTGPNAVDDFYCWLLSGEGAFQTNPSFMGGLQDQELLPGREDLVVKVLEFLRVDRPGETASRRACGLVQVVQGEGLQHGLRALANHVCQKIEADRSDDRPICFLPVSRYPADAEGHRDAISAEGLVANLLAFCRGEPLPAKPLAGLREVQNATAEIRAAIARRPIILVLDGWVGLSGNLGQTHGLAIADGVVELLTEIVRPRLLLDGAGVDPDLFYRNRILLLSEGDTSGLGVLQFQPPLPLTAPPAASMKAIADLQGRPEPERLAALCQHDTMLKDAALALAQDVLRRGWTFERPGGGDWRFQEFVQEWLKRLSQSAPLDLLILRLVAVARDGLRTATLHRLLRRWTKLEQAQVPDLAPASYEVVRSSVKALVQTRVLISGQDVAIAGLDDFDLPYARLSREDTDHDRVVKDTTVRFVDLPFGPLRQHIIDHMRKVAPPSHLARMHRLLAEDALDQHTIIARLGDWSEIFAARHYRRLVQALFHGFASLELASSEGPDLALHDVPHTLPITPSEAYLRLYSVYFRGLMERPPEWELSRTLGREDLKLELLLLAMNIDSGGRPYQSIHGGEQNLGPAIPLMLRDDPASEPMRYDQALSLARAAFHNNRIDLARLAMRHLESFIGVRRADRPVRERLRQAAIAKVQADIFMVAEPPGRLAELTRQIESHLTEVGFVWLDLLRDFARAHRPAPDREALADLDATLTEWAQSWSTEAAAPPEMLIAWSDLLSRWAEAQSLHTSALAGTKLDLEEALYAPFVAMFMAERLRRQAFQAAPLSRLFYVNGHSTRVLVRIVLQMVEAMDATATGQSAVDLSRLPNRRVLAALTRRHMDMLSRYLSRLPTERVSLLIMESQFARVVEGGAEGADKAYRLLALADRLLANVRHRPRVGLRFARERCLMLTTLALQVDETAPEGRLRRERLAAAAVQEARTLAALAKGTPSWEASAAIFLTATQKALTPHTEPKAKPGRVSRSSVETL